MNSMPTTRSVWLAAIALASVFAVGGACGVLADRVMFLERPGFFREEHHFPADPLLEADLSETQRTKIEAIFERHRAELDAVMNETEPKMRALADRMEREIDAILTPKQREHLKAARSRPHVLLRRSGAHVLSDPPLPGVPGIQGGPNVIRGYVLPPPGASSFGSAPDWVRPLESDEPPPPP